MRPLTRGKVIVCGILFSCPLAGVIYQFLHYMIALRRLGYDVYYAEDIGHWVYDPRKIDVDADPAGVIDLVRPHLEAHGFGERWSFRVYYGRGQCYGLNEGQLRQLYRDADALLNVTGSQDLREEQLLVKRRVYVESDPFATQVAVAKGDAKALAQLGLHDTHFSFGENLGAADCTVPIERFRWLPTRQPVVLDMWTNPFEPGAGAYNSIATWHNEGKDCEYGGETYYWTKDREFLRLAELPTRCAVRFELAATPDPESRRLLERNRWQLAAAPEIAWDPDRYRSYIQQARAEFTVARDQYARPRTGWFSDRSVCYLAAGRPVIAQDTGFSKFVPTGKGLFGFTSMDDALAAVDAIESDYASHCRAAREIAAEYFAAEKVVGSLMERAGL